MNENDTHTRLRRMALGMLREFPDAGRGSEHGNSLAGAALALTQQVPRRMAEAAVRDAVAELGAEPA